MAKRGRPRKIKSELTENEIEEIGEQSEGGLILCSGKYRLIADRLNITLQIKSVVGESGRNAKRASKENIGKVRYTNYKYFSNPKNALDYLVDHEVADTSLKDLKTICDKIDEVKKTIQAIPDNALPQIGNK